MWREGGCLWRNVRPGAEPLSPGTRLNLSLRCVSLSFPALDLLKIHLKVVGFFCFGFFLSSVFKQAAEQQLKSAVNGVVMISESSPLLKKDL